MCSKNKKNLRKQSKTCLYYYNLKKEKKETPYSLIQV